MKKNICAVILAGGKGARLWPLSSKGISKSFVRIGDIEPMILNTVKRLKGLVEDRDIFFVIDKMQERALRGIVKGARAKNICVEPFGRSTASAVGLAASRVDPESVLVVLPTDAIIDPALRFRQAVENAGEFVRRAKDSIVCFGVRPKEASTGYGYIKLGKHKKDGIYSVRKFIEKPSRRKAEKFLDRKGYLWNTGIFVFTAGGILRAIKRHAPRLYSELGKIKNKTCSLEKAYSRMKNMSIDYQIMEKEKNIYCIKGEFSWCDIGNWVSMENLFRKDRSGNILHGDVMSIDTRGSSVINLGSNVVGVIGLSGLVIVNTPKGVLVCNKKDVERVKELGVL